MAISGRIPGLHTVSQSAPARLSDHERPVAAHRWILAAAWGIWCTGFYSLTLLSFLLPPIQERVRPVGGGPRDAHRRRRGDDRRRRPPLRLDERPARAPAPRWPSRSPPSRWATPLCALRPRLRLAARRPGARRPRHRRHLGGGAGDARRDLPAGPARALRRHRPERRAGRARPRRHRRLLPGAARSAGARSSCSRRAPVLVAARLEAPPGVRPLARAPPAAAARASSAPATGGRSWRSSWRRTSRGSSPRPSS